MNLISLRNFFGLGRLIILLTLGLTVILSGVLFSMRSQNELAYAVTNTDSSDMLAYVSGEGHLNLYNPRDRTETTVLNNVSSFVIGRDGRIAFTKQGESDSDIYVFDPSTPTIAPQNISHNPTANNYPLAWSPDGHYLAFGSYQENNNNSLYLWDGETIINVMPENELDRATTFYVNWSEDDRLAFTVQYGWSNLDIPPEIYLWDGKLTTNLSQNPEGSDGGANWSRNGQLIFASTINEITNIFVWDGISFRNGVPDRDSFVRVAPELHPNYVGWTNEGYIAFTSYSNSGTKELILWDVEDEAIIRQIPVSSENAWSWLTGDGQFILSSHLASGIPSYYLDVENTEGEILFSTHTGEFSWSSSGYLAYCGIEEGRSRLLSIWDGEESWLVTRVSYKPIQWQNGRDDFSCNNG